ncbi:MAG: helix-turn-helix domain-containing protein [Desulfatibacillaceae bacterium]
MEEETRRSEELGFGEYLRQTREQRGIDIEDVSRRIKVSVTTLRSLEQQDIGSFPPEVFVLGFLRSYARAIGADDDRVVALYRQATPGREGPKYDRMPFAPAVRPGRSYKILLGIIILLGLIVGTTIVVMPEGRDPSMEPLKIKVPALEPRESPHSRRSPEKTMELHLVARENVRVKGVVDASTSRSWDLMPGDEVTLEGRKRFNLLLGSASGVALTLDGEPVPVSGRPGQPVNMVLP